MSFGGQVSGVHWWRREDRLGVAVAIEGLSDPHRDYLAAGGSGFLLGDGALSYAHEQVFEAYYRFDLPSPLSVLKLQLTPDFQYIRNPGYNSDRGPVKFWGVRFHLEI